MKVNRKLLLDKLRILRPGLLSGTGDEGPELIFLGSTVVAYHDDLVCRTPLRTGIACRTAAKPLLVLVGRMTDEFLEMEMNESNLVVRAGRKETKLRVSPSGKMEFTKEPKKLEWILLPEGFESNLNQASKCCYGEDGWASLIHFHPAWTEATDMSRVIRLRATNWKEPVLLKSRWVKSILGLEMNSSYCSKSWVSFKNDEGTIFSVRRYLSSFPKMDPILSSKGTKVEFPEDFLPCIERASALTDEKNTFKAKVQSDGGRLFVLASGRFGRYDENMECNSNPFRLAANVDNLVFGLSFGNKATVSEKVLLIKNKGVRCAIALEVW